MVRLQSELEKTEASCWASLLAHLCELLSSNCGHWEELNGRSLPHLRELTDIFEGRNYMDSNLRNTYNGIVKQVSRHRSYFVYTIVVCVVFACLEKSESVQNAWEVKG